MVFRSVESRGLGHWAGDTVARVVELESPPTASDRHGNVLRAVQVVDVATAGPVHREVGQIGPVATLVTDRRGPFLPSWFGTHSAGHAQLATPNPGQVPGPSPDAAASTTATPAPETCSRPRAASVPDTRHHDQTPRPVRVGLRWLGATGSDALKTTVEVVSPEDIGDDLARQWHGLQTGIADTPFMSPEFAAAVGRVRGDVFVIVVMKGDRLQAVWPLQRRHRLMAEPVGFGISDFQGPVVAPGFRFDPAAVLRRTRRFLTYDFDHLVDPIGNFARWSRQGRPSPFIDVDPELRAFNAMLLSRRSKLLERVAFKRRRAERELGAFEFTAVSRSQTDLSELISMKRKQYHRTGRPDGLGESWRRELLSELLTSREVWCGGEMSVLRVDALTIASHFGLRSSTALNWWFPVYDERYSRHSPGLLLLNDLLRHESQGGTRRIDLGTGIAEYKRRFATGAVILLDGSAHGMPGVARARAAAQAFGSFARHLN